MEDNIKPEKTGKSSMTSHLEDLIHPTIKLSLKLAEGNQGAAQFLFQLISYKMDAVIYLLDGYGLKGIDLYILFNDLCDRDVMKARHLSYTCPKEILVDACRRQDRSGIALVAPYFN